MLLGNYPEAERETREHQKKNHAASHPHATTQLACTLGGHLARSLLGMGGGSAWRCQDLRLHTLHAAVCKWCRVAVLPLDGLDWQNTRRVRLHPWQRREWRRSWRLQLLMSGALGGKLGKPLLACTSPVAAGRCGSLGVLHPGGREGPAGRAPGCAARRAATTVQSEGSAPGGIRRAPVKFSNRVLFALHDINLLRPERLHAHFTPF